MKRRPSYVTAQSFQLIERLALALGRAPTAGDVMAEMGCSRSTAFRHLRWWREATAWPDYLFEEGKP